GPRGARARGLVVWWGGSALRGRSDGPGRISAGDARAGALRGESAAGRLGVPVHLLDQRVDRVELQRGPLERDELEPHHVAVEVEIVIPVHVRLDGASGRAVRLEGGVGADRDGGRGPGERLDAEVRG